MADQPVSVPTGLPYGAARKLEQAQNAVPLPQGPASPAAPASPTPAGGVMAAALAMQPPTSGGFMEPGDPSASSTAGLPIGPGPGPEALPPATPPRAPTLDDYRLAAQLPTLEALADTPGATDDFRNYVRRLRGGLPPQVSQRAVVERQGGH